MKKFVFRSFAYAIVLTGLFYGIYSCTKVDVTQDDYMTTLVDDRIGGLESRSNHGCFEIVFPINLLLPDGTAVIAENQDSLKKILRSFCMANENKPRPEIVFPITIKAQDGTLLKVGSKAEFQALKDECFKNSLDSLRHKDDRHQGDTVCFTLLYPVQVRKPSGDTVTIHSKIELKALIKSSLNEKKQKGRFEFVFPLDVKLNDGSTLTLNSEDELKSLIRKC